MRISVGEKSGGDRGLLAICSFFDNFQNKSFVGVFNGSENERNFFVAAHFFAFP